MKPFQIYLNKHHKIRNLAENLLIHFISKKININFNRTFFSNACYV